MTDVLEYVLEGLEAALELERELGVRTVEIDRRLLTPTPASPVSGPRPASAQDARQETRGTRAETRDARPPDAANRTFEQPERPTPRVLSSDLVFLHDRPLSPGGVEMMAKIVTALKRTAENAPIVVAPPVPKAKIVVILGGRAMKKYFPDMKGEPGQWLKTPEGSDVLITYSPEYILRFGTVTPAVQKLKYAMWQSLKAVVQRLRQ